MTRNVPSVSFAADLAEASLIIRFRLWLAAVAAALASASPVLARGDVGCAPALRLIHGQITGCDDMVILGPANDVRTNLLLMQLDSHVQAPGPLGAPEAQTSWNDFAALFSAAPDPSGRRRSPTGRARAAAPVPRVRITDQDKLCYRERNLSAAIACPARRVRPFRLFFASGASGLAIGVETIKIASQACSPSGSRGIDKRGVP